MDIRPSAAVRAALASIDRSLEVRAERTRVQSRAMETSVADGAEAARMSANRVAENRARAAMVADASAAERQRRNAPQDEPTAPHGGSPRQQYNQTPRPGSVVDLRA
jgi:hypothetical protein